MFIVQQALPLLADSEEMLATANTPDFQIGVAQAPIGYCGRLRSICRIFLGDGLDHFRMSQRKRNVIISTPI